MTRRSRGNAGEAAVLAEFLALGFDACIPFGEGQPFDLAVHLGGTHFLRVQCKVGWRAGGCLLFNSVRTDHGCGPGSYAGLADAFGVHCPASRSTYLVPVAAIPGGEGRLRLDPPRNNQRRRVRLAGDYELARWSRADLISLIDRDAESVALTAAS